MNLFETTILNRFIILYFSLETLGLSEDTRLIPMDEDMKDKLKLSERYTALTHLFFLVHKAFQLSFHVLHARFRQLNQQLHGIQEMYEDLLNGTGSNSPEGEYLKKMMTNQMSQYMCINSSMRQPEFMTQAFGLVAASCRLLVKIARSEKDSELAQQIFFVPEFIMDNIVDFLTFLRHFDDSFFEVVAAFEILDIHSHPYSVDQRLQSTQSFGNGGALYGVLE